MSGGHGSLIYQVQEALKSILRLGESKRAAKKARQQDVFLTTGQLLPLNQVQVPWIYSIKTLKVYLNMAVTFALWCRRVYGVRHLAEIRLPEMGTCYIQERFLDRQRSAWTVKTVIAALTKLAVAIEHHTGSTTVGRIDREALGTLPRRRKRDRKWAGAYPENAAEAVINWIARRRTRKARSAAFVLELQWRCGLRISEAAGLRARMVAPAASVLVITQTNITKGGRDRRDPLPVPTSLMERLMPLVETAEAAGGPETRIFDLRPDYVRRRVRQACKALEIERHGTHGFRHAFANEMLNGLLARGLAWEDALAEVAEALGHSRSGITLTYVRE